jgi:two-component system CheB/CheR fusion protein
MRRNLKQLASLLNDLVDASRVVSGSLTLQMQRVDLQAFVAELAATWRPMLDARKQTMIVQNDHVAVVDADRVRLAQILSNLVVNASKFTNEGGLIRIATRLEDATVAIEVGDTGVGLTADAMARIFEPYWPGAGRARSGAKGLGLGLAIVRRLVELHGGRVSVHSDGPGRGSVFTIRLPLRDGGAARTPAQVPRPSLAGLRVLVVDDEPDVLVAVAGMLGAAGASVQQVATAREALSLAARDRPDVVVADINMPGEDGYWLRERLSQEPATQAVPVLALTAHVNPEDKALARRRGFIEFVEKPVDPERLCTAILTHVSTATKAAVP